MNRNKWKLALGAAAAVMMAAPVAQAVDFEFGGQIRPRFEYVDEGAQGLAKDKEKSHTTMRTRLNVKATIDDDTSAFLQIQDVRTWGGENPTTAPPSATQTGTSVDANGLDVHQAYVTLNNPLDLNATLKVGRQEMIFDEHRLIGNIGWIQQAQSFDALRADFGLGSLNLTAFVSQVVANDSHPTLGATIAGGADFESYLSGIRATYSLGGKDRITPYYYYAINAARTGAAAGSGTPLSDPNLADKIHTVGVYVLKHFNGFRVRFDGAYQFGDQTNTVDIQAFMLTAAVGHNLDIAQGANLTLWYDYLSGDDGSDPTESNTFNTLYATNHAFYGHIDKFLNVPTRGLQDIALKFWVKPTAKLKLVAHAHAFLRADTAAGEDTSIGQEIDLQAHYPLTKKAKLSIGYSHFFSDDEVVNAGVGGNTTLDSNWAFAMINVVF